MCHAMACLTVPNFAENGKCRRISMELIVGFTLEHATAMLLSIECQKFLRTSLSFPFFLDQ